MVGKSKRNTRKNTRRNSRRNTKRNSRRNTRRNLRRNSRRNTRKNLRRHSRRNIKRGGKVKSGDNYCLVGTEGIDKKYRYIGISKQMPRGGEIFKVEDTCPKGFEVKPLSEFEGLTLYKSIKKKKESHQYLKNVPIESYRRNQPLRLQETYPEKLLMDMTWPEIRASLDTESEESILGSILPFEKVNYENITIGCRGSCKFIKKKNIL